MPTSLVYFAVDEPNQTRKLSGQLMTRVIRFECDCAVRVFHRDFANFIFHGVLQMGSKKMVVFFAAEGKSMPQRRLVLLSTFSL